MPRQIVDDLPSEGEPPASEAVTPLLDAEALVSAARASGCPIAENHIRQLDGLPDLVMFTPVRGKDPLLTNWNEPGAELTALAALTHERCLKQGTGLGLLSGHVTGLLVVDLDTDPENPSRGRETFLQITGRSFDDLPATPTTISGKVDREKRIYRVPESWRQPLKGYSFKKKETNLELRYGAGRRSGDFKAVQSVILGPHPESTAENPLFFRWREGSSPSDLPIAEAPEWLLEAMLELIHGARTPVDNAAPDHELTASCRVDAEDALAVPLIEYVALGSKNLIKQGSQPGSNNDDGIKLSLDLIGAEQWLMRKGVQPYPSATDLYARFVQKSAENWDRSEPFDEQAAWVRFETAPALNPGPSTPEDKLETRLAFSYKLAGRGDEVETFQEERSSCSPDEALRTLIPLVLFVPERFRKLADCSDDDETLQEVLAEPLPFLEALYAADQAITLKGGHPDPSIREVVDELAQRSGRADEVWALYEQVISSPPKPLDPSFRFSEIFRQCWENYWGNESRGFEANDRPIDRQAAEKLIDLYQGNLAYSRYSFYQYRPEKGYWVKLQEQDVCAQLEKILCRFYQKKKVKSEWVKRFCYGGAAEVKKALTLLAIKAGPGPLEREEGDKAGVVVFENGTYNLATGQLTAHSPHYGATFGIRGNYVDNAQCPPEVQRVIDTCLPEGGGHVFRANVRQVIDPTIRYGEAFQYIGGTGSGKGLMLRTIAGLLPAEVQSNLKHPKEILAPEKVYQYVLGRQLILFSDTPAGSSHNKDHLSIYYQLVENDPVSVRRLNHDSDQHPRRMNVRCMIAAVEPLQLQDRDGFHRRHLILKTLDRVGEPDATLRAGVDGDSERHWQMRGELASWALQMPLEEVNAVLDGRDPEGLLAEAAEEYAVCGDHVSSFIDACLVPHKDGPSAEVMSVEMNEIYEAYLGYCGFCNITYTKQRDNFIHALRSILGPKRHLKRRKETRQEYEADGRSREQRRTLSAVDAGFQLRRGLMDGYDNDPSLPYSPLRGKMRFMPTAMQSGGLRALQELPQAERQPQVLADASDGAGATGGPRSFARWAERRQGVVQTA